MLTLEEILNDFAVSPYWDGAEKADVNSHGLNGTSPLHFMAYLGDDKAIRILIDAGAVVNVVDEDGNTPLHQAVMDGQASATRLLIKLGADINFKNKLNQSPLDIAKDDVYEPCIGIFKILSEK